MAPGNPERLHGTLELLILKLLGREPMNGYAIGRRIRELTRDELVVEEGSLYPALYRMQRHGWLRSEWGTSENNRRAKFYRLSAAGQRQLEQQAAEWGSFRTAVDRVVGSA